MEDVLRAITQASEAQAIRAWREQKTREKPRNRDASNAFGISEADLIASAVGEGVTRRRSQRSAEAYFPSSGVMAMTRNESCVQEKDGPWRVGW